jgi:hypothetical protein
MTMPDALASGPAPSGRVSPPDSHGRWLRELEQAHATLRARAIPTGSRPATASGAPLEGRAAPDRGAAQAGALPGREPDRGESQSRRAPTAAAAGRPGAQATSRHPSQATPGAPPPNARHTPAQQTPPRGTAPARGFVPVLRAAPFPKTNAHALVRERTAAVWIRDASLDAASHPRLLQDIRARLWSAGLRIASLVVNGRRVDPAPAEPDNPEQPNGGNNGN